MCGPDGVSDLVPRFGVGEVVDHVVDYVLVADVGASRVPEELIGAGVKVGPLVYGRSWLGWLDETGRADVVLASCTAHK